MSLWRRLVAWVRRLFRRRPRLPAASSPAPSWAEHQRDLPEDFHEHLSALSESATRGAVHSTVAQAIEDFVHLRQVILGPAASAFDIDDLVVLGEAEATLRALVVRAPAVQSLMIIAAARTTDRPGREAAGEAVLELREQARVLHEAASAAIQWAASRSDDDVEALRASIARLQPPPGKIDGGDIARRRRVKL